MSGNSNGMQTCPSKEELMKKINEHSFAVDDLLLYLDTHPQDVQARGLLKENGSGKAEIP